MAFWDFLSFRRKTVEAPAAAPLRARISAPGVSPVQTMEELEAAIARAKEVLQFNKDAEYRFIFSNQLGRLETLRASVKDLNASVSPICADMQAILNELAIAEETTAQIAEWIVRMDKVGTSFAEHANFTNQFIIQLQKYLRHAGMLEQYEAGTVKGVGDIEAKSKIRRRKQKELITTMTSIHSQIQEMVEDFNEFKKQLDNVIGQQDVAIVAMKGGTTKRTKKIEGLLIHANRIKTQAARLMRFDVETNFVTPVKDLAKTMELTKKKFADLARNIEPLVKNPLLNADQKLSETEAYMNQQISEMEAREEAYKQKGL